MSGASYKVFYIAGDIRPFIHCGHCGGRILGHYYKAEVNRDGRHRYFPVTEENGTPSRCLSVFTKARSQRGETVTVVTEDDRFPREASRSTEL